jgi:predicted DNA-binding transcriptional regulator AlpA
MSDRLLTEKEAAQITGLSVAWFQRKRWEGGGPPFIKLDHAVRYRQADLFAWLDERSGFKSTSEYAARRPAVSK